MIGRTSPASFLIVLAAGVAAVLAGRPAGAASAKECVSVQIEAPFRLPDHVLRPAGEITLCDSRAFSPVVQLHAILVNGSAVGMFASRIRNAETGPIAAPLVLFERDAAGTLDLVGYVVPAKGRSKAFRLRDESAPRAVVRTESGGGGASPVVALLATDVH